MRAQVRKRIEESRYEGCEGTEEKRHNRHRQTRAKNSEHSCITGLGGIIDLERSAYSLGRTMYEPEQFPGLIYRMGEPKVVILLFASGKLVCTGAKKEEDVYEAVTKLHKKLEEGGLIYYE